MIKRFHTPHKYTDKNGAATTMHAIYSTSPDKAAQIAMDYCDVLSRDQPAVVEFIESDYPVDQTNVDGLIASWRVGETINVVYGESVSHNDQYVIDIVIASKQADQGHRLSSCGIAYGDISDLINRTGWFSNFSETAYDITVDVERKTFEIIQFPYPQASGKWNFVSRSGGGFTFGFEKETDAMAFRLQYS